MAEDVPRSRGVVRRFSEQKGYGFIKPDEGGDDLFVHHSDIKSEGYRTLQPGQVVEFFVELDNDKTKAVDVTGPNGSSLDKARNGGARGGGRGGGGYGYGNGAEGRYGGYRGGGGGGGGGGGECYKCGEHGHIARDCEQEGGGRRGGGGRGDGACFNCGGIGHMARDCTSARLTGGGGCYTCGEHGHIARECPNEGGGRGFDRYGGGGGGRGFDRYGGGGRGFDRFGGRGGGGGGGGSCYNCGDPGHFARDCPTS